MSSWGGDEYDETAGDEDDDEDIDILRSVEDNVMVLIDARPSMFVKNENGEMPFVTALRVTRHLLRQKIMLSQRDYVGVILFGAEKESEATEEGEGEGGFTAFSLDSFGSQVIDLQPLEEPTAKRIKDVERLCQCTDAGSLKKELKIRALSSNTEGGGDAESGLRNGIRKCLRALEHATKKGAKASRDIRRIWLFTDEDEPSDKEDPSQVIRDARESGVEFRLWYFPDPTTGKPFEEEKFYAAILASDEGKAAASSYSQEDEDEALSDKMMLNAGGDIDKLLVESRTKAFKKRRYNRLPLVLAPASAEAPPISLQVALYKTIMPAKKPTPIQLAAATNKKLISKTKWMCESLAQYVDLDMDAKYSVELLGQDVTFEKKEFDKLKKAGTGEMGIHLLGFIPASELAWELNVSAMGAMLYPEEDVLEGCTRAFIALREAMIQRQVMALVRYQRAPKAESRMAVLTATKKGGNGLELILLPYLDDIREVVNDLSVLGDSPICADKTQVERACDILSKLLVDGEFTTAGMPNPALQKFFSILQALALEESEGDWDEQRDDKTVVDDDEILDAARDSLEDLWGSCPDRKPGTAGSKCKAAAASSAALDGEDDGGGSKKPKKKKARVVNDEDDLGDDELPSVDELVATGKIHGLKVDELKAVLRHMRLPVSGKKGDLIDRIINGHQRAEGGGGGGGEGAGGGNEVDEFDF